MYTVTGTRVRMSLPSWKRLLQMNTVVLSKHASQRCVERGVNNRLDSSRAMSVHMEKRIYDRSILSTAYLICIPMGDSRIEAWLLQKSNRTLLCTTVIKCSSEERGFSGSFRPCLTSVWTDHVKQLNAPPSRRYGPGVDEYW